MKNREKYLKQCPKCGKVFEYGDTFIYNNKKEECCNKHGENELYTLQEYDESIVDNHIEKKKGEE